MILPAPSPTHPIVPSQSIPAKCPYCRSEVYIVILANAPQAWLLACTFCNHGFRLPKEAQ